MCGSFMVSGLAFLRSRQLGGDGLVCVTSICIGWLCNISSLDGKQKKQEKVNKSVK